MGNLRDLETARMKRRRLLEQTLQATCDRFSIRLVTCLNPFTPLSLATVADDMDREWERVDPAPLVKGSD